MLVDWPFDERLLGSWLTIVVVFSAYNLLQGRILGESFRTTLGLLGLSIAATDAFFYGVFWFLPLDVKQAMAPYVASLSMAAITLLASRFTRPFLEFDRWIPDQDRRLGLAEKIVLLPLPGLLVFPPHWVALAQLSIGAVDALFWTWAFLSIRRTGAFGARLMAIAWPGIALGAMFWFARNLGLIESSAWLTAGYILGIALEGVMVSLALSYRLKKLARDSVAALSRAEAANRSALALQGQLRSEIAERTEELRRQEIRADEEHRSKQAFLSLISHDLRGPLSSASQAIRALQSSYRTRDRADAEQLLQRIGETLGEQVGLVDRLLDLETLKARQGEGEAPPGLSLHRLVEQRLEAWQRRFLQRGIRLQNRIDKATILYADPLLLETVLDNLLANALKHMPEGGELFVDQVPMQVDGFRLCNSAPDLDDSARAQIEETFDARPADPGMSRADSAAASTSGIRSTLGSSRGLGLQLAREVMRGQGGDLRGEVDDSLVCFRVVVPVVQRQVLVVDDQALQLDMLADRLLEARPDLVVHRAAGVSEALELLESRLVDLILSDVRMPERDGFDLLRRVRANPGLEALPLILSSAVSSRQQAQELELRAAREGADAFYPKPLCAEDLEAILEYLPPQASPD